MGKKENLKTSKQTPFWSNKKNACRKMVAKMDSTCAQTVEGGVPNCKLNCLRNI